MGFFDHLKRLIPIKGSEPELHMSFEEWLAKDSGYIPYRDRVYILQNAYKVARTGEQRFEVSKRLKEAEDVYRLTGF